MFCCYFVKNCWKIDGTLFVENVVDHFLLFGIGLTHLALFTLALWAQSFALFTLGTGLLLDLSDPGNSKVKLTWWWVVGGIRWLLGQGDLVNITLADILTATATHTMIRIPTTAIETKIFLSMIEQWRSNQSVSLITLITKTRRVRFMLEVFYQLAIRK